ncbi:MAG: response regulator [Polyangiaceae bacterium]
MTLTPSLAEGRLQTLIEGLSSAALLEDEHRRVLQVNTRFCELFAPGAAPSDLVGTDCSRAAERVKFLMLDPEGFVRGVDGCLSERKPRSAEVIELSDGRVLERDYMPVHIEGVFRGHFWNYRDVTQQHRVLDELKLAKEEAERSSMGKDLFVAALSHELRSQLHSMLGNLELLRETRLDDAQLNLLRTVRYAAKSQLALIGDLLDLSALRAGTFSLDPSHFTLKNVSADVVASQSELCRAKHIDLSIELDPRLPERVFGDGRRFGQVLTNLLANAVRHCDKGRVRVQIIRAAGSGSNVLIRCEVEDTGAGVAPEDEAGLFTPFHRASDPNRRRGGTGLGLAICRQLVEAMGGAIGHFPTPGGGATFWFTVRFERSDTIAPPGGATTLSRVTGPLLRSQSSSALAAVRPMAPTSTSPEVKKTILVVEDTPTSRIWAKRVLESRGYEVLDVAGGQEALDLLENCTVDLILMDWQMPVMDGLETTRRIRARGGVYRQLPILGLSANARSSDLRACLDAGMNDCLFKPVSIVELTTKLNDMLFAPPAAPSKIPPPLPEPASPALQTLDDVFEEIGDTPSSNHLKAASPPTPVEVPSSALRRSTETEASAVAPPTTTPATTAATTTGTITASKITGPLAGLPVDVVKELVDLFRQGSRECRTDLETALSHSDAQGVRKVLHKLVGMTGNLGHTAMSARLRTLHDRMRVEILAKPLEDELRAALDMVCSAAEAQHKRYGL